MNETTRDSGQDRLALLQTFLRVAEAGSFSAAAQQLATTQPTVSRRVQMLESLLGARLYLGISEARFRQVVLGLLTLSGVAMLVASVPKVLVRLG